MTTCARTLDDFVRHLACQLDDLEGTSLQRIAAKQGTVPGTCDGPDQAQIVVGVEDSLNFIRWSEDFLTAVINDGFRILALERPDLFVTELAGTLTPGCARQTAPDGCMKFGAVMASNGKCSVPPSEVSISQVRAAQAIAGLGCPDETCANANACDEYEIESWSSDPDDPCHYYVTPIPPADCADIGVTVTCSGKPPCYVWPADKAVMVGAYTGDHENSCLDAVLDLYEPWLIEYAMYRAYMADRESVASFERSKEHWDKGMRIIDGARRADYTYHHPDLFLIGPIAAGTGNQILRQGS